MKHLLALLLLLFVAFGSAAPAAQKDAAGKKPLIVHSKQRRWKAAEIKAHHERMRKVHKNYVPSYPVAPVTSLISVGTPPVQYVVSLETGSEAIFLLAKDYPGRNFSASQPFYDPARSSTSKFVSDDYTGYSGDLAAMGSAYDDVVGIFGFQPNFTQRFGVVEDVYAFDEIYPAMPDGVVGLSWDPMLPAVPNEKSAPIINLFGQDPSIPLYYCSLIQSQYESSHGEEYSMVISFGDCMEHVCEAMTPENTLPLIWWETTRSLSFAVDLFEYQGYEYDGAYAKVDTGVPDIMVPQEIFQAIHDSLAPWYDYDHHMYTVCCTEAVDLDDWIFTIGGRQYVVPASAYVVDLELPDKQCALSVTAADQDETTPFVFGYIFNELWCIKMDIVNQAIGISNAINPTAHAPALKKSGKNDVDPCSPRKRKAAHQQKKH